MKIMENNVLLPHAANVRENLQTFEMTNLSFEGLPVNLNGKIYRTVGKGQHWCIVQRHGQQRRAENRDWR